jgi:hypothetical protein
MGSHTFTTVTTTTVTNNVATTTTTTISSHNVNGLNVITLDHPSDTGNVNITDSVTIPVPQGMKELEFDEAVLNQANTMMQAAPSTYEVFPDNATEGNCHTTTTNLIQGAGGDIPDDFDPKGLNPGLE